MMESTLREGCMVIGQDTSGMLDDEDQGVGELQDGVHGEGGEHAD